MQNTISSNEFTIRPPTQAEIPAIVATINQHSQRIEGINETSIESYQRMWTSPGYDATADSRIAVTSAGRVVGAVNAQAQAPYVRGWLWVRVHPDYWQRGLGTQLTAWGEARLHERIDQAPLGARVVAATGILDSHQLAAKLLLDQGYRHIRSFYAMKIEMKEPPPTPVWPSGITVKGMAPGDEEVVYRAMREAFRDHWGHVESPFEEAYQSWTYWIKSHPDFDPSLFFVAWDGAEVAGISLCFPKDNEYPDMAWVEDLAVRRPWRRQGLALALLHHSFGEFYRRSIYKAGLGVDASNLTGALRLYERAGMESFRQFNSYEKELRAGEDLITQSLR